ncbi:MAG: hypothetical protein Q8O94_01595 [bacterium]|nr:hypothetical protein [bacterium]
MMTKNVMKIVMNTITAIGVLASVVAIGISLYSLHQSNVANDIAHESLTISQRPYVSVDPVKFDNGKFIFIKNSGGKIEIKFRFKISNRGNSAAQNIRVTPIAFSITGSPPENPEVIVENKVLCSTGTGSIALAPGDYTYLQVSNSLLLDESAVFDLLKQFNNDELSVPFNIEVTYQSDMLPINGKTGLSLVFLPSSVSTNYSVSE